MFPTAGVAYADGGIAGDAGAETNASVAAGAGDAGADA